MIVIISVNGLTCSHSDSLMMSLFFSYCLLQIIGINYFHCLKVLELLKVAEGDQKSLFGQYTSQRVKVMSCDVITSYLMMMHLIGVGRDH